MSGDLHGLFDEPGPRGVRRIRIATAVCLLVLAALLGLALAQFGRHGQLAADKWTIFGQLPVLRYLGNGLAQTMLATVVSAALAVPLGVLAALARLSRNRALRWVAGGYIEVFRAVPVLLLLFAFLVALPRIGLTFPIFWQLVLPIVISNVAVIAEIFRAGVRSLPRGQSEACYALGMTYGQTMRLVLLPQALRLLRPALVSQLVRLLKESTLGYVVSFLELLYAGKVLGEYTHTLVQTYLVVALIFVAINALLSWGAHALQRRQDRPRRVA